MYIYIYIYIYIDIHSQLGCSHASDFGLRDAPCHMPRACRDLARLFGGKGSTDHTEASQLRDTDDTGPPFIAFGMRGN